MADFEDFGTQQAGIDRRRKIAEMLINQGMQQDGGQMVSGHYVAPSNLGYVAKLAQMLVGNNNLSALDKEQGALKQRMNEDRMGAIQRYADLLQGKEGTPTIRESAPASMDAMGPNVPERAMVGAVAPNPKAAMMELLKSQDPSLQQFGMQSMLKGRDTSQAFGKIDPKDYTPDSIVKFARTGDHTVLVPSRKFEVTPNGLAYDPHNLQPGMLPGFVPATSAVKGAEERAKAGYDMVQVNTPQGPIMVTREQAAQMANQSQPAAPSPQATAPRPGATSPDGFPRVSPQVQQQRDSEAIQIARQELAEARTPQEQAQAKQALDAMLARQAAGQSVITGAAGKPQQPGIRLQSEAEKLAEAEKIKTAAEVDRQGKLAAQKENTSATKMFEQMKINIKKARQHLNEGATGSGVGSLMDSAMGSVGISTDGSRAAAQLETLAGWMTANVPRMEGPQSDRDTQNYKIMAAMVGDRTKPVAERLAALDTLEFLQDKYKQYNDAAYAKTNSSAAPSTKSGWSIKPL